MNTIPAWIAPTIAISLLVIAACLLTVARVAVAIGLGLRRRSREFSSRLSTLTTDAQTLLDQLMFEVEGYVELSSEARAKLKGAMTAVETRLEDLDALADVLQEEVQESALSAASMMRTVRRSGSLLGLARRAFKRRRSSRREG
jgi:hypothetical protein